MGDSYRPKAQLYGGCQGGKAQLSWARWPSAPMERKKYPHFHPRATDKQETARLDTASPAFPRLFPSKQLACNCSALSSCWERSRSPKEIFVSMCGTAGPHQHGDDPMHKPLRPQRRGMDASWASPAAEGRKRHMRVSQNSNSKIKPLQAMNLSWAAPLLPGVTRDGCAQRRRRPRSPLLR